MHGEPHGDAQTRPEGGARATPEALSGIDSSTDVQVRAHLSTIVDRVMDAVITIDDAQRIVLFNRAAQRIFGVELSEALGSPLDRFIPARFRQSHARKVDAFGRTGHSERSMGRLGTLFGLRQNGQEFPIEASISHADVGGRGYSTVILRDVSERMRLEAQLIQAQKMESLGRLAGGIAHDFNNLIMAIFNYLALASRTLDPGHPGSAHLSATVEVTERAAGLTRQLLAFARKQPIGLRTIDLRRVVDGVEPILRRVIGSDVQLIVVHGEGVGTVMADASQLEQVLMNLAVNARDAMSTGGTMTIETERAVLDAAQCRLYGDLKPGEHAVIAVSDTGTGMTAEVVSRLFEPFFTTKEPGKGTGLGLATCHGIVSQLGGHIAVKSELGRGSTFKVILPRAGSRPAGEPAAPAPSAP